MLTLFIMCIDHELHVNTLIQISKRTVSLILFKAKTSKTLIEQYKWRVKLKLKWELFIYTLKKIREWLYCNELIPYPKRMYKVQKTQFWIVKKGKSCCDLALVEGSCTGRLLFLY